MSEEETTEHAESTGDPDDAALIAEVEELTRPEADKDRDKVKSALIAAKRELRDTKREVKRLEPIAASATDINARLGQAQPIIDAVLNNPKLRAEAIRISQGTRATGESTEQPDDADAIAMAEEMGFYQADGVTPDAARGARVLARLDARHGKQTDDRIRPLAGITLNQKANANLTEAINSADDDGTPLATRESIMEVAKQLPQQLLADPSVVDLVLNSAIGLDKRKKRTPKPQDEPLFLERQGGGGRQREAALTSSERSFLKSSGITEEQYRKSASRLEQGAANRRGIELGKD